MRILWLKSELLHPVDKGGKIRTYQMLRHLKRDHKITYLSLVSPSESPEAFVKASEYCSRLATVPFTEPAKYSRAFYRDLALNVLSPLPYAVGKYRSKAMERAIEAEVARGDYDVVVCDFLVPSVNMRGRLPVTTVLFQHNVESMIWRRHFENASGGTRAFFYAQWRKMQRYERAACRAFDAVVAVSENDRDVMREEFGLDQVFDVPTGVDHEFFRPLGGARQPHNLVFTGSMDWMPNEDAIAWFVEAVMPLVEREIPDVTLTVVGRSPTPRVLEVAGSHPRVTVTGRVDDIRPYVDAAAAYVVPIRVGGGTRLKIYEAMAMAKPVVSTTVGAEGLPVRHGEDLLVADEPAEFAASVVRVLRERELAEALGERARALVQAEFGWERASEVFAEICEHAAARERGLARAAGRTAAPVRPATMAKGGRA